MVTVKLVLILLNTVIIRCLVICVHGCMSYFAHYSVYLSLVLRDESELIKLLWMMTSCIVTLLSVSHMMYVILIPLPGLS